MVKKPETRWFLFVIIWGIVGIWVLFTPVYDSPDIVPVIIKVLLWFIVFVISFGKYLQHADLENWVCTFIQYEWKHIEKPISALPSRLSFVLLVAIRFVVPIIAISLAIKLVSIFVYILWIVCDNDISKFGENINNYMSIILVFIFMAQAWIFYQQYHHMKQPFFKAPLLWTLSKSKSDTDCCILLKNGRTAPIFNILYYVSEVLVTDIWGFKIPKPEEISKDFLPRLDDGFEKEIFGKPTEEFKEMRLAVNISAKTLDGHSTRLLFYKAPGDVDFSLALSAHTQP
jgi:hypothetical protein